MLTFVELLDILEQAALNRVVIECAPRIRRDRSDGSHLSAVVVLDRNSTSLCNVSAIIPQVAENDVEAGADAGIQGLPDSADYPLDRETLLHFLKNLIVHSFDAIVDKDAARPFHQFEQFTPCVVESTVTGPLEFQTRSQEVLAKSGCTIHGRHE